MENYIQLVSEECIASSVISSNDINKLIIPIKLVIAQNISNLGTKQLYILCECKSRSNNKFYVKITTAQGIRQYGFDNIINAICAYNNNFT